MADHNDIPRNMRRNPNRPNGQGGGQSPRGNPVPPENRGAPGEPRRYESRHATAPGKRNRIVRRPPRQSVFQARGCLNSIFYVMFVLGASMLLAASMIFVANDAFAFIKEEKSATVVIPKDASGKEVAEILKDAGLIDYPFFFQLYAKITKSDQKFKAGTYELDSKMDYTRISANLKLEKREVNIVRVTIRPGLTQEETLRLLADEGVSTYELLAECAKNHDFNYSFIKELPKTDNRLEGYLFPDTYEFYKNSVNNRGEEIIQAPEISLSKILSNFSRKFSDEYKSQAAALDYSIQEIMTIASMIEREGRKDDERPVISSVIHNRLESKNFPRLQIDATVQYVLPQHKEVLTQEDLDTDSPYNTYIIEGLPPGPIASPGLRSIEAALYPDESNYYYYVAKADGYHIFSRNLAQHEQAIIEAKKTYDQPVSGQDNTIKQ